MDIESRSGRAQSGLPVRKWPGVKASTISPSCSGHGCQRSAVEAHLDLGDNCTGFLIHVLVKRTSPATSQKCLLKLQTAAS